MKVFVLQQELKLQTRQTMSIAPISQFFILSPRGDTIISKDYRGNVVAGTTDTFFRKVGELGASLLEKRIHQLYIQYSVFD